jgi:predicted Rossmann fold nucleotide-binding protein DprA/Smf involved in DNA uptake
MSDIIHTSLKTLKARRKVLQPLASEYEEVESAIQALQQAHGAAPKASGARKRPRSGPRRGRPRKGEPTRSDQFLALVQDEPGLTIGEGAKRLGVQPSSLYRVVAQLQERGAIEKRGRGIHPHATTAAAERRDE